MPLQLVLGALLIVLGFGVWVSEYFNLIHRHFPLSEVIITLFTAITSGSLKAIFAAGIAVPLIEELLFRRLFLVFLLKHLSAFKAILFSSLAFAAIHFNLQQFTPALVMGLLLGYLFYRTQSLLFCVIVHGIFNTQGYLINNVLDLNIAGFFAINDTIPAQPPAVLATGTLLLIIGAMIIFNYDKRLKQSKGDTEQ